MSDKVKWDSGTGTGTGTGPGETPERLKRIIAGLGLTGGGDLSTDVTIDAGEGPGIDITEDAIGFGGDTILLYDSIAGGNPVEEFPTIALALAAATSGQLVQLPPGIFVEDITIPAGVTLTGIGSNTKIQGIVTLGGADSHMKWMTVELISYAVADIVGLMGGTSGVGYIDNCHIIVINHGTGKAWGAQINDGDLHMRHSWIETIADDGDSIGVYGNTDSVGNCTSNNNLVEATCMGGGVGHAYWTDGFGDIFVTAGSAEATTSPVGV